MKASMAAKVRAMANSQDTIRKANITVLLPVTKLSFAISEVNPDDFIATKGYCFGILSPVHPLAKRIGSRLKRARKKQGISLESFCKEQGFSLGYMSDIENGKRLPTIEMLDRIARALKFRIRDFF